MFPALRFPMCIVVPVHRLASGFRWLVPLVLTGCANMLGLDGLSYDQGLEEESNQPSAQGDGDQPSVATSGGGTGVGLNPNQEDPPDDFPMALPSGAIFVAVPQVAAGSRYWIYDPDARELTSSELRPGAPDILGTSPWSSLEAHTHVAAFPSGDEYLLLGYERESGAVSLVRDRSGEGLEVLKNDAGTTSRDVLLSMPLDGDFVVLSASSKDGHYRYFDPDPQAGRDVVSGEWDADFSGVAPFSYEGEEGVLKLDPERSLVQFQRLTGYGEPFELVFETELSSRATHVFTFEAEGTQRAGFYDSSQGSVFTGSFGPGSEGVAFYGLESSAFREGLSQLQVVYEDGKPWAITFSPSSGLAQLRSLAPLDGSPVVVR